MAVNSEKEKCVCQSTLEICHQKRPIFHTGAPEYVLRPARYSSRWAEYRFILVAYFGLGQNPLPELRVVFRTKVPDVHDTSN